MENTRILAQSARKAGVRKIVHVSVSNPSHDSPFAYFRGKAAAEDAVRESGVPCSIIRPTLVFGREDILFKQYRVDAPAVPPVSGPRLGPVSREPVFVGDVATLAVQAGSGSE